MLYIWSEYVLIMIQFIINSKYLDNIYIMYAYIKSTIMIEKSKYIIRLKKINFKKT